MSGRQVGPQSCHYSLPCSNVSLSVPSTLTVFSFYNFFFSLTLTLTNLLSPYCRWRLTFVTLWPLAIGTFDLSINICCLCFVCRFSPFLLLFLALSWRFFFSKQRKRKRTKKCALRSVEWNEAVIIALMSTEVSSKFENRQTSQSIAYYFEIMLFLSWQANQRFA